MSLPPRARKLPLALAIVLTFLVWGVPTTPAQAADTVQTKTCVSGSTTWTFHAIWGERTAAGKLPVRVEWTAPVGAVNSYWWAKSTNSDGSIAQNYTAHGVFDYAQGTRWQGFDVADPTAPAGKVRVGAGHYNDGVPDCGVDFTAPTAGPQILFEDNFDGAAGAPADPAKWTDYGPKVNPRFGFGKIKDGNNEVTDGQGNLVIPATPTAGSGLMSAGKFTLPAAGGTISYRYKVPKTEGYWSAGWSENDVTNGNRMEIDTVEHYSHKRNPSTTNPAGDAAYAHSLVHAWQGAGTQIWGSGDPYCALPGNPDLGDDFHTYSTVVTPDTITSYIDGRQCGAVSERTKHADTWYAPPVVDKRFYLIMNLAVGGACSPCQVTPPKNDVLLVDRVWVTALS